MLPFSEEHSVDHPVSLYAATKKSNELIAHSYSHLYGLPTQDYASLLFMDLGGGLIWLYSSLLRQ